MDFKRYLLPLFFCSAAFAEDGDYIQVADRELAPVEEIIDIDTLFYYPADLMDGTPWSYNILGMMAEKAIDHSRRATDIFLANKANVIIKPIGIRPVSWYGIKTRASASLVETFKTQHQAIIDRPLYDLDASKGQDELVLRDYSSFPDPTVADIVVGMGDAQLQYPGGIQGGAESLTRLKAAKKRAKPLVYDPLIATNTTLAHEISHTFGNVHEDNSTTGYYGNSKATVCEGPEILEGQRVGSITHGTSSSGVAFVTIFGDHWIDLEAFVPLSGAEGCGNDPYEADALSTILETRNYVSAVHETQSTPFPGLSLSIDYATDDETVTVTITRENADTSGSLDYVLYSWDHIGVYGGNNYLPGVDDNNEPAHSKRALPETMQAIHTASFEAGEFEYTAAYSHPRAIAPKNLPANITEKNVASYEGEDGHWIDMSVSVVILDAENTKLPLAVSAAIPREGVDLVEPSRGNDDDTKAVETEVKEKSGAVNIISLLIVFMLYFKRLKQ